MHFGKKYNNSETGPFEQNLKKTFLLTSIMILKNTEWVLETK